MRNSVDFSVTQQLKHNGITEYYETNQITIQSNSSTKRKINGILSDVNAKKFIRRRIESNRYSVFEFINKRNRIYEIKYSAYTFFNKPKTFLAIAYHILAFIQVSFCLTATVLATDYTLRPKVIPILLILDKSIIVWFVAEFLLRLWSSSCKKKYKGLKGKWNYVKSYSQLMDLLIIALSVTVLITNTGRFYEVFAVSAIRGFHRFFQVFQILVLNHQIQPWKLMMNVLYDQRDQLLIMIYIQFIIICILTYLIFLIEKTANKQFDSLGESMYYAVVTVTSVGYGDKAPITWVGKLVVSSITFIALSLVSLPAGIIGAGLAIRTNQEHSLTLRKKRKLAAIILIQRIWHYHKLGDISASLWSRKRTRNLFVLNSTKRIAFEFIALTKFFVAKSKFKRLLRPYDTPTAHRIYKFNQRLMIEKVQLLNESIITTKEKADQNEISINNCERNLSSRLEELNSLAKYIEEKLNKQINLTNINDNTTKL